MSGSFSIKAISLKVILAEGDFGGGNTLTVPGGPGGLDMNVDVTKPGLPDRNKASVQVKGLSLAHMEEMTTLGFGPQETQKNLLEIEAGDTPDSMSVIFQGEIMEAYAVFKDGDADAEFKIEAESGGYPQLDPEPPVSVAGNANAAALAGTEAKAMGYAFKDETGGRYSVRNGVYRGSPLEKLRQIARETGAQLIVDDREVILLEEGKAREGDAPLLSKGTGLIGYPTFTSDGIQCRCLFNPEIRFGGLVVVESIVPKASGTWKVTEVKHSLSSGDSWHTEVKGEYAGEE